MTIRPAYDAMRTSKNGTTKLGTRSFELHAGRWHCSRGLFYEPPSGTVIRMPGNAPHEMQIDDGWSRAHAFSLDHEGFAIKEFDAEFDRFDDDNAVRDQFYGPVAEFVKGSVERSAC